MLIGLVVDLDNDTWEESMGYAGVQKYPGFKEYVPIILLPTSHLRDILLYTVPRHRPPAPVLLSLGGIIPSYASSRILLLAFPKALPAISSSRRLVLTSTL
jgi:hypothetical protein